MWWWDRERPWTVLVPPVTAAAIMVLFFWLTDRWENLENPVQSQIAIFAAVGGFIAGIFAQRIRRWEWLVIPGAVTVGVMLWRYFQPHDTAEDREFRQILWVLALVLAITTLAINIPQVARGRYRD